MGGRFSASFRHIVEPYLPASVFRGVQQQSTVEHVFFGADDAVLIKLTNGSILWEGLPASLEVELHAKAAEGWTLSKNTTLCQWDKNYYFVEWTRLYGMETSCAWNVKSSGFLTDIFIREIVEGQYPVSQTLFGHHLLFPIGYPRRNTGRMHWLYPTTKHPKRTKLVLWKASVPRTLNFQIQTGGKARINKAKLGCSQGTLSNCWKAMVQYLMQQRVKPRPSSTFSMYPLLLWPVPLATAAPSPWGILLILSLCHLQQWRF